MIQRLLMAVALRSRSWGSTRPSPLDMGRLRPREEYRLHWGRAPPPGLGIPRPSLPRPDTSLPVRQGEEAGGPSPGGQGQAKEVG